MTAALPAVANGAAGRAAAPAALPPTPARRASPDGVDLAPCLWAIVARVVRPRRLHIAWNDRRRVWQAWAGAPSYGRATLRGEWTTEAGALRHLLDLYLQLHTGDGRR